MRWTEADYLEYLARTGASGSVNKPDLPAPVANRAESVAHGRLPASEMNGLEAAYDAHLWLQRHSGAILWHKFEAIKLRLADKTFLTVDFAAVKLKVAASIYPFRFILVRKIKGAWSETEVKQ